MMAQQLAIESKAGSSKQADVLVDALPYIDSGYDENARLAVSFADYLFFDYNIYAVVKLLGYGFD